MRFVHLSDMHLEPDPPGAPPRDAADRFLRALRSVNDLNPRPDFVVTGGDHVMDCLEATPAAAKAQWELYSRTIASGTKLPIYPIIGNHDVFGWMNPKLDALTTGGYGKGLAQRYLKLREPYYSFDAGGWHFVVVDNVQWRENGYQGGIDGEQFDWLAKDLAASGKRPTVVFTHIPILSVCATQFLDATAGVTFWQIPHVFVQTDSQPTVDLLSKFNVRLAVSGHIHMNERIEYRGVSYICNGSICGNWWRGAFKGFEPGYGIFDLTADGGFRYEFVTY